MFLSFGNRASRLEKGWGWGIAKNKVENEKPGVKYSGSVRILWLFDETKRAPQGFGAISKPILNLSKTKRALLKEIAN